VRTAFQAVRQDIVRFTRLIAMDNSIKLAVDVHIVIVDIIRHTNTERSACKFECNINTGPGMLRTEPVGPVPPAEILNIMIIRRKELRDLEHGQAPIITTAPSIFM